jgi:acyl-CoA hydrolase
MNKSKTVKDSIATTSHLVMPNETNPGNMLMGGNLMYWMDVVGAICAQKHSNAYVVTASVDNISFKRPIALGDIVSLRAQVTRAFRTSMEVYITVQTENIPQGRKAFTNSAFMTFVALDKNGRPLEVPELIPETEEEQQLFERAIDRRKVRLQIAEEGPRDPEV